MTNLKLLDVVVLRQDIPDEGLRAGMRGTVVDIHYDPCLAYEVEFCDDLGKTIALLALLPVQIERVWTRD
jgi:hypothetical protein